MATISRGMGVERPFKVGKTCINSDTQGYIQLPFLYLIQDVVLSIRIVLILAQPFRALEYLASRLRDKRIVFVKKRGLE